MLRPHEPDVIIGFGGVWRIERNRFPEKAGRLVIKARLVRCGAVIEIESRGQHSLVVALGFIESFFESGDSLLRMFCLPERKGQVVGKLRGIGKTLSRLREKLDGAFAFFEWSDEQLRQTQRGVCATRIDQQTLFIIRRRFREFRFGRLGLVCASECSGTLIQKLREQVVRLVLFRMLRDDFLQHLDRLRVLICQHESRRELFARIRIVRL